MAPVWKCDWLLKRRTAFDYVNSIRVNSRCSFRLSSNLYPMLLNERFGPPTYNSTRLPIFPFLNLSLFADNRRSIFQIRKRET